MGKIPIVVYVILLIIIWSLFTTFSKYEGKTAEEWYYKYDEQQADYEDLYNCVDKHTLGNAQDLLSIRSNCL